MTTGAAQTSCKPQRHEPWWTLILRPPNNLFLSSSKFMGWLQIDHDIQLLLWSILLNCCTFCDRKRFTMHVCLDLAKTSVIPLVSFLSNRGFLDRHFTFFALFCLNYLHFPERCAKRHLSDIYQPETWHDVCVVQFPRRRSGQEDEAEILFRSRQTLTRHKR